MRSDISKSALKTNIRNGLKKKEKKKALKWHISENEELFLSFEENKLPFIQYKSGALANQWVGYVLALWQLSEGLDIAANDVLMGTPGDNNRGEYYHRRRHGDITEQDRQRTIGMVPARPPSIDLGKFQALDFMDPTWHGIKMKKGSASWYLHINIYRGENLIVPFLQSCTWVFQISEHFGPSVHWVICHSTK